MPHSERWALTFYWSKISFSRLIKRSSHRQKRASRWYLPMISPAMRSILILLLLFYTLQASQDAQQRTYDLSNQRSADSNFKYAWFTREVHDQPDSDEQDDAQQQIRARLLRRLFHRRPPIIDSETILHAEWIRLWIKKQIAAHILQYKKETFISHWILILSCFFSPCFGVCFHKRVSLVLN